MRKWITVLLISLLVVFAFTAAALADNPDLELAPQFNTEQAVKLWDSVCFQVQSKTIRSESVKFYFNLGNEPDYDEPSEPLWIWLDENGYGEAWFTPGTTDVFVYHYQDLYKEAHTGYMYTAYVQAQEDGSNISNPVTFTTVMDYKDPPAFTPAIANVSSDSVRQDDVFRVTLSDVGDFDIVCLVAFDGEGNYAADSHWFGVESPTAPITLEMPLVTCQAGGEYVAKVYGLKFGYPMAYSDKEWPFRVISPSSAGDTDILIGGLRENYVTGEQVRAAVYYPNSENMEGLTMDIGVYYADDDWFADHPDDWNLNFTIWPEGDSSLLFFPNDGWQMPECWMSGTYRYFATVWQEDESGQRIKVDTAERFFTVSSEGPIDFEPQLPDCIDIAQMPYTLTIPRVPDANFYYVRIENWDDHDWDAEPEWDNLIAEFSSDDPDSQPKTIDISGVNQRICIMVEAAQYNHEWYRNETIIPILNLSSRITLRTEDSVIENSQPIHADIPLWVAAPGAEWLRLENEDGEFGHWENPEELARGIECNAGIHRKGVNHFIATACFDGKEEQAILVVRSHAVGDAGEFTASLDKTEVTRGELVNVTFTESKNATQYWVDLDRWNDEQNEWMWYTHLADLRFEDENEGGTSILNTISLEPGIYRVRALAQGVGFNTVEYPITESFVVNDTLVPDSGLLAQLSADQVETSEEFEVSAFAPGAADLQVFWNYGEDDWDWQSHSDGRDAWSWRQSYGNPGTYQILVRAWFNEFDGEGNPVWAVDEETGEIHTDGEGNPDWQKQYSVDEILTVKVTADKGKLTLAAPAGIPEKLSPTGQEQTVSFTLKLPENAEYLRAEAWLKDVEDGNLFFQETQNRDLDVSFSVNPEIGQTVSIRLWASARGYEQAELNYQIPVLPDQAISDLGYIDVDEGNWYIDDQGICHVPIHGHVEFVVHAAEGHTLTAVKFYGTHGWWEGGEEINHKNHDDWFNDDGSAFFHEDAYDESQIDQILNVSAMVRVDGGAQYYLIETFPVQVDDYYVGAFDFASLEPVTVEYGKDAVFTFTESEGAGEYWVDAWDIDDPEHNYNPQTTCSGTTVTMNTAQLQVGEFIIRGRAGTGVRGDLREAESDVRLIVTASDIPAGSVSLTVDKDEALTGESIYISFFAPGADWVNLIRLNESGEEDYFHWREGAGASFDYNESWAQNVRIFGEAHYLKRDEKGDPIPTGELDDQGNPIYEELDPVRSAPHSLKITAPNGRIPQDASAIPVTAEANKALRLVLPKPETGWMGWEIYTNRISDDNWQEPDYRGEGSLDKTLPAGEVLLGNIIEVRAWTDGVGYEHNHQNYQIMVTGGSEDRITLTVSKTEVQVNEDFKVTVTAPGAEFIQYNNGYGFWTNYDDESGQEVISELRLDENGQWFNTECYGNSDTMTLYARTFIDGVPVTSDPVRVTVKSIGQAGEVPVYMDKETVTRGETAILHYEPAEHSVENDYDLRHYRNREGDGDEFVDYHLDWTSDPSTHTFSFSTAGMPAGEYRLSVWVRGEKGYESRESRTVSLFVTEAGENTVSLEIPDTNVQTNEDIMASVYAPGAYRIEIFWDFNDDIRNYDGESCSDRYSFNEPGIYQVFARAYYEQEGQEDRIADSDPVTVTVTSNGKKLPLDLSGLPVALFAGNDAPLFVGIPEGATYMGYEIYLNWTGDWSTQPDYYGYDFEDLSIVIPADRLEAGTTVQVRVWTGAIGYDHNHQSVDIPVLADPAEDLTIETNKNSIQTLEGVTVSVNFPAGHYSEIQFFDGYDYRDQEDLGTDETSRTWNAGFESPKAYSMHARLWNTETESWVYTGTVEVEVTAPNGPLTFDTSTVPAKIYENMEASFTLVQPENATQWNYELRDEDADETLISWDVLKNGQITIPAEKIFDGHLYRLNYNASGPGYVSIFNSIDFMGAASPTAVLSVDRKTLKYGEAVAFTVNAPGAEVFVRKLNGEEEPTVLEGLTWTADQIGAVSFEAVASFPGFEDEVLSNIVTVNVQTVGPATEPGLEAPVTLQEGDTLTVTVTPADGVTASLSIFDSGDTPVKELDNITSQQDVSIENVHAGAYQVYVFYGKAGYDDGHIETEIRVAHVYNDPEWVWEGEYTGASLVLSCQCGAKTDPIEARVNCEVTADPTCETPGEETWTAQAVFGGQTYTDVKTKAIPATGHKWGRPVFTWDDSDTTPTATATFTCRTDDTHTRTENAQVAKTGHEDASCTEPEADIWTAECEGFTDEHKVTTGNPTGHSGDWYVVWNDDYTAFAERKCDHCGETEQAGVVLSSEVIREATCQTRGEVLWTASPTLGGPQVDATKKQYTPKAGHTPGEPTYTEDGMELIRCTVCETLLSCEYPHAEHNWKTDYVWAPDGKSVTATRTCTATPEHPHSESDTAVIVETIVRSPTETEEGIVTYTGTFSKECFPPIVDMLTVPAFGDANLLRLPAGLTVIGSEAFAGMSFIQEVIVPDGCTSIAADAFAGCDSLIYISLPSDTVIEGGAFTGLVLDVVIDRR